MASLCREFGISRITGYNVTMTITSTVTGLARN
ncbi:MAG TPA: hypothetical protein VNB49_09885 [Candidatus Dormibacteraeota bacterium]|nr:hypothetical protein [Candidatus Dormibacteraeota bacterium]